MEVHFKYNKYKNKKVVLNGIKFDSEKEAVYYLGLCNKKEKGEIEDFELQPKFELQPGFVNNKGKKIREITYVADFLIKHKDKTEEVIDVKGFKTPEFKLKKKMFEYRYPNHKLTLV